MKKLLLAVLMMFLWTGMVFAADITLKWEASTDATGYKIYKSLDLGVTWDAGIDVGNVTTHVYTGVEETGIVLFRMGAYNSFGEAIMYWAFAGYNHLWRPPLSAQGLGVGDVS